VDRALGLSVRLRLTHSYAGFLVLTGAWLLAAVWVLVLRDLPHAAATHVAAAGSLSHRVSRKRLAMLEPLLAEGGHRG
jgi:hypothetical protein